MSKPLTYKPFAGVEWAWSPDLVDARNDRPDLEDVEPEHDLSGLRPVRVVERYSSFQRGKHTVVTKSRIITNRPTGVDHVVACRKVIR